MEKIISNEASQIKAGLFAGGITAIPASICCLGPLLLVLPGVGGAWVSTLTWFYPLKPYLTGGTYLLLAWTGFQLYRHNKYYEYQDC